MSSHHIVRDGQEPALLVASSYFNTEVLFQLLEWSPVVIVYKQALQRLLDLDVKIDVVFCSENDFAAVEKLVLHQNPVSIKVINADAEMPAVYAFMKSKKYSALNIIGNNNIDDTHWQQAATLSSEIKTVYFTYTKLCNAKAYLLTENTHSKWMAENVWFGVKSVNNKAFNIEGNYQNTETENVYKTTANGFIAVYGITDLLVFEEIF